MPSGCRVLNCFWVTLSKAFLVAVPKAELTPLTAVITASLIGPAGMGVYFDAAAVVAVDAAAVVPVVVLAFVEELHAAMVSIPAAARATLPMAARCVLITSLSLIGSHGVVGPTGRSTPGQTPTGQTATAETATGQAAF